MTSTSEGFTRLLPVALQVPGVTKMRIRVVEVPGEDLSEILPAIDHVSWQMIQPGPSRVD
jgi:hypothetical protein